MSTAISELHRSVHFHYTIIRCCVTLFPGCPATQAYLRAL